MLTLGCPTLAHAFSCGVGYFWERLDAFLSFCSVCRRLLGVWRLHWHHRDSCQPHEGRPGRGMVGESTHWLQLARLTMASLQRKLPLLGCTGGRPVAVMVQLHRVHAVEMGTACWHCTGCPCEGCA